MKKHDELQKASWGKMKNHIIMFDKFEAIFKLKIEQTNQQSFQKVHTNSKRL